MKRYQIVLGLPTLALLGWILLEFQFLDIPFQDHERQVIHTWCMQLPWYALIVFGCYALANIGLNLMTFQDCPQASEDLRKDIVEAKEHLRKKKVPVGDD